MFKIHIGNCSYPNCGRTGVPIVVRRGWCDKCNYTHKQAKKLADGKKKSKSFKSYSYKEPTGEADLFATIAEEREWKCFVTDETLYELKPSQFLHVLAKALNKHPKYKLYAKNVVLASDRVHRLWDFHPRSELLEIDPRFQKLFDLEAELKSTYPNLI